MGASRAHQHLSGAVRRDRTRLGRRFVVIIASKQENQAHLPNSPQDEERVRISHGMGPQRRLFEYLYGVQVVAGSNPVAPI
jgi:hypothetical protein